VSLLLVLLGDSLSLPTDLLARSLSHPLALGVGAPLVQYASVFSWLGRCIEHLNEETAPADSSTRQRVSPEQRRTHAVTATVTGTGKGSVTVGSTQEKRSQSRRISIKTGASRRQDGCAALAAVCPWCALGREW